MISEAVYLHYLNSLLDGDKQQCVQIVINLVEQQVSIKEIYMELFQRSMYRIGQLWEKERCSIAKEHVATKITEGLIELVSENYLCCKKNGKLALVTCVDKEFHELGARMVAGFLQANGWDTLFAGSNTPANEILFMIRERNPELVGISISFYVNLSRLVKLINDIKNEFPFQTIIVGGQALAQDYSNIFAGIDDVTYITCLNGLEKYLAAIPE